MTSRIGVHRYAECGLENVDVVGVELRECPNCGKHTVVIPNIAGLHKTIARHIATKRERLVAAEVRFLRTYLGHARDDFARMLEETLDRVNAWETGKEQIPDTTELRVRAMAVLREPVDQYDPDSFAFAGVAPPKASSVRVARRDNAWTDERPAVAMA
ncbi:MAG: hypothetical protein U0326_19970 [Polyangiales bacterium]